MKSGRFEANMDHPLGYGNYLEQQQKLKEK